MDGWLIPEQARYLELNRVCCLTDILCSCIYLASVVLCVYFLGQYARTAPQFGRLGARYSDS